MNSYFIWVRIDVLDKYVNLFISIFYWFLVVCSVVVVGEEFVDFFVDVLVVFMVIIVVVKDIDVDNIVEIDVKMFCVVFFVFVKLVVMVCFVVVNFVDCFVIFGNNVIFVGGEDLV